jgi:hypothetical protein
LGNREVGEKLNWGLPEHAVSSRDTHRYNAHERCLRKSETLTTDKESSLLSIVMLYFTAVIPLLGKSMLMRSQAGDFNNIQEAVGMPTDLMDLTEV